MFKKNKKFSLSDLKDKFLHRANLLYGDMKDKFEVLKEEKENTLSLLNKTQEELENKLKTEKINKNKGEKNYEKTADLLYPTMKNKEENNIDKIKTTKKDTNNMQTNQKNIDSNNSYKEKEISKLQDDKIEKETSDKTFKKFLEYLYPQEGGYSNRKEDLGGKTNLGVTQSTYDWYNKKNQYERKDVKNITKEEATKIYYDYFWKNTGADKIKDKKLALIYFDSAINHGPYYAKKYYKESNGDFDKFLELRKQHYKNMADRIPGQNKNYNGWINRLNNLTKFAKEENLN